MNGLALCAGVGGLELGIGLALGDGYRTVCFVEREAHAAAILVARMEDGTLDQAPIWDDLTTFDGRPWASVVDLVSAGYPCQPFSLAGSRRGADDPRHLWPHVARIIAECGPAIVVLENVPGHLSLGLDAVGGDLGRMGYRVACGLFSAGEVGASHRRERLFVLAYRHGGGCRTEPGAAARGSDADDHDQDMAQPGRQHCQLQQRGTGAEPTRSGGVADSGCRAVRLHDESGWDAQSPAGAVRLPLADRDGLGCGLRGHSPQRDQRQSQPEPAVRGGAVGDSGGEGREGGLFASESGHDAASVVAGSGEDMEHTTGIRRDGRIGEPGGGFDPATGAGDPYPDWPPSPGDGDAWGRVLEYRPDLAPATQSPVRGMADGMAARVDRLRACGNGVVPLAAAYAIRTLAAELVIEMGADLTRGDEK